MFPRFYVRIDPTRTKHRENGIIQGDTKKGGN